MNKPIAIVGVGGPKPGIQMLGIEKGDVVTRKIVNTKSNQSIYKVAISSSAARIACASKSGEISVYDNKQGYPLTRELLYRSGTMPCVVGLTFVTDDILCVGGSDMQIRIFDISKPRHQERVGVIPLHGLAFGLTSLSDNKICALVREGSTDHLMIWDIINGQKIYTGPGFKISSFYLNASIDYSRNTGYIVHGDRNGQLHIYNALNNYSHEVRKTNHGNFYGVSFNNSMLFTASDANNGEITSWSINNFEPVETLNTINFPVHWLVRLDNDYLVAGLPNGSVNIIDVKGKMNVTKKLTVPDIRNMASLPAHVVNTLNNEEKIQYIKLQLEKIKQLFEDGNKDDAYKAIVELENKGFQAEALQALAYAEKAEGLLLNELEALLLLLDKKPVNSKLISLIRRIATIYELIYEPQLAINTYIQLSELLKKPDEFNDKIATLEKRVVPPDTNCLVLLSGFPSRDAMKNEIRKAEILNRYFVEAVALKDTVSKAVSSALTIDKLLVSIKNKLGNVAIEPTVECVIIKSGHNISDQKTIIRIKSNDSKLSSIETWVELQKHLESQKMINHRVFYPDSINKDKFWNSNVLKQFKAVFEDETAESWYQIIEKKIESALIAAVATLDIDEEEDEFI